eukprot:c25067_g1_i1.p1 GENE.c25067_g1_i1~~c25067_g1_i1.p1  ORF type:complete len:127 (+),score=27.42 c25067_g1_i1:30-410(+)
MKSRKNVNKTKSTNSPITTNDGDNSSNNKVASSKENQINQPQQKKLTEESVENRPNQTHTVSEEQQEILYEREKKVRRLVRNVLVFIIFIILHQLFLRYVLNPYLHQGSEENLQVKIGDRPRGGRN